MKFGWHAKLAGALALVAIPFVMPVSGADETIKIAYVDPLSGGMGSTGDAGLKTFQYLADELNGKGGALGRKFEIVPYDNKLNAQETLVQVQKAIDSGIRIITH